MKKGQIAVELLIITAILLVVFFFFLSTINTRKDVSMAMSKQFAGEEIGYLTSSVIHEAYLAGDSASRILYLPNRLKDGSKYNITLIAYARHLKVSFGKNMLLFPLATANVTGSFTTGSYNTLSNTKGVVSIG